MGCAFTRSCRETLGAALPSKLPLHKSHRAPEMLRWLGKPYCGERGKDRINKPEISPYKAMRSPGQKIAQLHLGLSTQIQLTCP